MSDAEPRPRRRRILGSGWFQIGAAVVLTGLLLSFVAKPYWVPSRSMQATLETGDRVLVNRLAFVGAEPSTGDVIVFDAGPEWLATGAVEPNPLLAALRWIGEVTGFGPSGEHTLIKRVIAGPGQTVSCCTDAGEVVVDGDPLDEPYVTMDLPFQAGALDCTTTPASLRCFDEVQVPDASYLMLGDNRANSDDSAQACRRGAPPPGCWRWAHDGEIVGKAVVVLWPIDRWRAL